MSSSMSQRTDENASPMSRTDSSSRISKLASQVPTLASRIFRGTRPGTESLPANFHLPRHRHLRAYVTVVLAGSFEESGYAGRIRAVAGDLLIHPVLDCHANWMISPGATILRLTWPDTDEIGGLYRTNEFDSLIRIAEKDSLDASLLLQELLKDGRAARTHAMDDWPDLLAGDLRRNPAIAVGNWAEENGLARETVARRFASVYGIPPSTFRSEWRARAAWLRVTRQADNLSAIAANTGFSDQAHMTRWISRISGAPPGFWRREQQRKDPGEPC